MNQVPRDVADRGAACVKLYKKCLKNGCSPRFAEMLALQQAPRGFTDDVFLAQRGTLDQQIKDPEALRRITSNARKKGYAPKPTDYYDPGVARYPGDPEAFFNHGQGRGKLKEVLESRGVESEGAVTTKRREPLVEPKKRVHRLHPRLVKRHMQRMVKENPDLARKDKREMVHEIVTKHGSPGK